MDRFYDFRCPNCGNTFRVWGSVYTPACRATGCAIVVDPFVITGQMRLVGSGTAGPVWRYEYVDNPSQT